MKTKLACAVAGVVLAVASTGSGQQTTFTKITNSPIATDGGNFTRCVWGDFHNNGFLDLFVCNHPGTNLYYRNNGGGTFTKISQGPPVQDLDYHTGAVGADFDNDGLLDLLVSAGVGAPTARRNMLYHNNGDGTFSPVSGGSVTNQLGYFNACACSDYNHDGLLDLFVTDSGANGSGGKSHLFHNNGDGTFTNITSGAIVNDFSDGSAALWADYDDDGFMDLIVINFGTAAHNLLYHNNRNGTFTRILTNAIVTDSWPTGADGGAWGDYDNDGLPDLFVTDNSGTRNHLYHNNGGGSFTNVTSGPMLQPPSSGGAYGCAWGDYDNDGYLDLFVSGNNGTNGLYHNNGDGTFVKILSEPPANGGTPGIHTASVAWVDYDNDGFLDLFVTRNADSPPVSNLLFHNNGNSNAWLEVKLVGTVANRSAIGAKVRLHATIGGKTFWQMREINNGGGWNIQPLVAHFGLGDATNADTLRIEWPSGTVQEFHDVTPKQILTITEPPRLLASATNGVQRFSLKGGRGFQYDIQASTNLAAWTPIGTVTVTNLNGTVQIVDTNTPAPDRRFYRALSH